MNADRFWYQLIIQKDPQTRRSLLDILSLPVYRFDTSSCTAPGPFVKPFTTIAIVIFSLVAVLHLPPPIFGWGGVIQRRGVAMGGSGAGVIVPSRRAGIGVGGGRGGTHQPRESCRKAA